MAVWYLAVQRVQPVCLWHIIIQRQTGIQNNGAYSSTSCCTRLSRGCPKTLYYISENLIAEALRVGGDAQTLT